SSHKHAFLPDILFRKVAVPLADEGAERRRFGRGLDAVELDGAGAEVGGEVAQGAGGILRRRAFEPEAADEEGAGRAIELEVGASGERTSGEDRQDVVAVNTLCPGDVDLELVVEVKQLLDPRPLPPEVVEGRQ